MSSLKETTDDVGSNKISLSLDENNDISIIKLLGVSVMYFSHASNKVESTSLGLAQSEKCDASRIEKNVCNFLVTNN